MYHITVHCKASEPTIVSPLPLPSTAVG